MPTPAPTPKPTPEPPVVVALNLTFTIRNVAISASMFNVDWTAQSVIKVQSCEQGPSGYTQFVTGGTTG